MKYEIRGGYGTIECIVKPGIGLCNGPFVLTIKYEDDAIEVEVDTEQFGRMLAGDSGTECVINATLHAPDEDGEG